MYLPPMCDQAHTVQLGQPTLFIEMKTYDLLSYKTSSPQNSRKLSLRGLVGVYRLTLALDHKRHPAITALERGIWGQLNLCSPARVANIWLQTEGRVFVSTKIGFSSLSHPEHRSVRATAASLRRWPDTHSLPGHRSAAEVLVFSGAHSISLCTESIKHGLSASKVPEGGTPRRRLFI